MDEKYLTPEEVANRLKVNKVTIYRMARSGRIPAFKFGKSWRISLKKLDEMFNKKIKR